MTAPPQSDFAVFRAARAPIAPAVRESAGRDAYAVMVLAMLDVIAGVTGATADAVRAILAARPDTVSVALEDVDARDAHAVVVGLARAGVIDATAARVAHCRIDRRCNPTGRRTIG